MKKFEEVSNVYSYAKELCKRTLNVYTALKEMNEPSRLKDIADYMKFFIYDNVPNAARVVNPLYWLKEMGLVDYEEREEIIEYKSMYGHYEYYEKTDNDGIVWSGRKWRDDGEPIRRIVKIKYWYTIA